MASVWYIGYSDVRTIPSASWTAVGASGSTTTWDQTNRWSVDQATLTAPQIAYLDGIDEFVVTNTDGPRPGSVVTPSNSVQVTFADLAEMVISQMGPGRPFTPEALGAAATYSSAVDDTSFVTAAIAAAKAARRDVLFTRQYKMTSGVTWDPAKHSWLGVGGAVLDFSAMSSGTAIAIASTSGVNFDQVKTQMAGLQILGPSGDTTTVDAISINGAGTNNAAIGLSRLRVTGFRDQLIIGDNLWLLRADRCSFEAFKRRGLSYAPTSTAGENLAFNACVWQNGHKASDSSAVAVYVPQTFTPEANLNFVNCSFDYNDFALDVSAGTINLIDCHVEDQNTTPMIKVWSGTTSGQNETVLNIIGGRIYIKNAAAERTHLIESVAGDRARIVVLGVRFVAASRQYDIVRVTAGTPQIEVDKCYIPRSVTDNTKQILPGPRSNLLYNGDWELNNANGWTIVGSVGSSNVQSVDKRNGTYALAIAGTGAVGQRTISQKFACKPGQVVVSRTSVLAASMTAGDVKLYLRAYAADGTTTITSDLVSISANQAWAEIYRWWAIPAGTAFIEYRLTATDLNGTVTVDDCYMAFV